MRKVAFTLAVAVLLGGCAIHQGEVSTWPTASVALVDIKRIVDVDHAEIALYVAAQLYETSVGAINQAHAKKLIPDADYAALVQSTNSPAARVQTALQTAYSAVKMWRNGASRSFFDQQYAAAASGIVQLAKEVK